MRKLRIQPREHHRGYGGVFPGKRQRKHCYKMTHIYKLTNNKNTHHKQLTGDWHKDIPTGPRFPVLPSVKASYYHIFFRVNGNKNKSEPFGKPRTPHRPCAHISPNLNSRYSCRGEQGKPTAEDRTMCIKVCRPQNFEALSGNKGESFNLDWNVAPVTRLWGSWLVRHSHLRHFIFSS